MKDETGTRWFWVATICNIGATILLILLIYASLIMLALFTSPVSMLPYFLIPVVVLVLSAVGLPLARKQNRRFGRWLGYLVHFSGFLLAVFVLGYIGFLWSGVGSGKETYLIPDRYQGDVYVIYLTKNGSNRSSAPTTATYVIPPDGILIAPNVGVRSWSGWTKTRYYYLSKDGRRREITERWDSTVPDMTENRSNVHEIGIFFPRSGYGATADGCHFHFDEFYVGTKAYLLKGYKERDISAYLKEHGVSCPGAAAN